MDTFGPEAVFYLLTAIAVVAWLSGVSFLIASSRKGKTLNPLAAEQFAADDSAPPENLIIGGLDVDGIPPALSAKAAAALAQFGMSGVLKVIERTDEQVVFEGLGRSNGQFGIAGGGFRRGLVRFTPLRSNRTHIDYAVETPSGRMLIWAGSFFCVLGLVAIIAGFWVISTYALSNLNPGARWQAVQMVQTVHFLWPPFLFGVIYRRRATSLRDGFDALFHNLSYTADPLPATRN